MIIGITGTLAAGKGTIVDFLKKRGFKHYSVRDYLILEIERKNLPINRDSMVLIANVLRKNYSPSYIIEQLYEMAKENKGDSIIESIRAIGEVESLKNKKDFYLFSVNALPQLRYTRAIERGSETDRVNYEEFISNEKREMQNEDSSKQNIARCMELADFQFSNNGSIQELENKVLKTIEIIKSKTKPRESISWDEYFMGIALLSAQRSKDPSTQVGACIVDKNNKIVGTGYNGFPRNCSNEDFPWEREGNFIDIKYPYICHAELNAILNSTTNLENCKIYVGLFPCNECAKAIIQSGIKKVIYLDDKYHDTPSHIVSRKLFNASNVEFEKVKLATDKLEINFN